MYRNLFDILYDRGFVVWEILIFILPHRKLRNFFKTYCYNLLCNSLSRTEHILIFYLLIRGVIQITFYCKLKRFIK